MADHSRGLALQKIVSDHVLGLNEDGETEETTIATIYDTILRNWIAPLPADFPVRVRQSKERLARRIAAEVLLACSRIRRLREAEPATEPPVLSQDSAISVTSLSSQVRSAYPSSSQSQPSLPSSPPSLDASAIVPATASDPLYRLSQHLANDKSVKTPIPPGVGQILSHWHTALDPHTYNWDALEQNLQDEVDLDDEEIQAKLVKAQRRQARQEKRQKREDYLFTNKASSQSQALRSSPGPSFSSTK